MASTINRLVPFEPSTQPVGAELTDPWTEEHGGRYAAPASRVDVPIDATEVRIAIFLDRRLPRDITPQERLHFLSAVWRAALAGTPGLVRQLGGLPADPEQFDLQAVSIRQTYFPTAGQAAAETWLRGVVAATHLPSYREFTWSGSVRLAVAERTYDVLVMALLFGT